MSQKLNALQTLCAHGAEIYLVGGPVRDRLLQLKARDRDWLVVGATPEQMKAAGFVQIGKDFPVFLHPTTKEEYALARTERKSGAGYHGFICYTSPEVTLEEDLMRRDFTINAMALDDKGRLHDPYHGQRDLQNRILRHVSQAFSEDPLRILRGARFLARFHHLGFALADETRSLMSELVSTGELEHLSAERVWSETERALMEQSPEQFFVCLRSVAGLDFWFAELKGCSFRLPDFLRAAPSADRALLCWGWLLHGRTEAEIISLCQRLKVPKRYLDFARLVHDFWFLLNQEPEGEARRCLALLERAGVFRQGGLFELWLALWLPEQDALKNRWRLLSGQLASVMAQPLIEQGLKGPALGKAMEVQRLELIRQAFPYLA